MLLENLPWDESGGRGDSVGRNAFAYICWPNESKLKESILSCLKLRDDTYIQSYRYPNFGADTMSRDHLGAIILALYINRDREELRNLLDNLPFRISRKYSQTVDFWLWQKSIKFEGELVGRLFADLFLVLNLLMFVFVVPYNALIRKILGIKKLKLTDFPIIPDNFAGIRKVLLKTIYPQFALFLLGWQIKVMRNSPLKSVLQNLLLLDSGNVVLDAVLGKSLTQSDYDSYIPMTSFIWSRRLDSSDDVFISPMTPEQSKFNDLNLGMLDYFRLGIDVLMLYFPDEIIESIKSNDAIIRY